MCKEVIKMAQEELNNKEHTNEYSIYDYLKKTPSVLIAGVSAVVAIITFLAKVLTNINSKNTLAFWNIDLSNVITANDSLIFQSLMSIFYTIATAVIVAWLDSICKAQMPFKKYEYVCKCLSKQQKKQKNKNAYKELSVEDKKLSKLRKLLYLLQLLGVYLISFIVTSLYIFTTTDNLNYLIILIFVCSTMQFATLFLISRIKLSRIKKNKIKMDCKNGEYLKHIDFNSNNNDKSIRRFCKNENIMLFAIQVLVTCLLICVSPIFFKSKPIDKFSNVQIVTLDEKEYIIAYQSVDKYFMKETKVIVDEEKGSRTLVVYTDKQKIVTSDNMNIEIRKYDDIKIIDIGEEYK